MNKNKTNTMMICTKTRKCSRNNSKWNINRLAMRIYKKNMTKV
jgi:hypothetical protein